MQYSLNSKHMSVYRRNMTSIIIILLPTTYASNKLPHFFTSTKLTAPQQSIIVQTQTPLHTNVFQKQNTHRFGAFSVPYEKSTCNNYPASQPEFFPNGLLSQWTRAPFTCFKDLYSWILLQRAAPLFSHSHTPAVWGSVLRELRRGNDHTAHVEPEAGSALFCLTLSIRSTSSVKSLRQKAWFS